MTHDSSRRLETDRHSWNRGQHDNRRMTHQSLNFSCTSLWLPEYSGFWSRG